jgi:DNA recombination protein RmuC
MEIIFIIAGLVIGFIISWIYFNNKEKGKISAFQQSYADLEKEKNKSIAEFDKANGILKERLDTLLKETDSLKNELLQERLKSENNSTRLAKAEVEFRNLQEKLTIQKAEYEELQKKLTTEFENIANKVLKVHSQEFTLSNQKNIGDILNPLREKITEFEKKVNDVYDKELRDKISLKEEVKKLYELNHKISEEANNLTRALKGDSKKQGNWGEVVLERILERSGLVKGQEYEMQVSITNEEGKRFQPDAVVYLPDKKHIIIDSKVSLVAYENYVNVIDEEKKTQFIKEHLLSVRTHIKGLSEKNYEKSASFNTPDFVLLFIPIESSFGVAVQADQELFNYAWDNKIVIVSPSTLLATLRTIASIWKQENQTKNALEIANQGGALYDKFVGFIKDLEKIGINIRQTQNSYDDAMNKLQIGKGNLITRAENIKKLGAKAKNNLPEKYISEEESETLFNQNII